MSLPFNTRKTVANIRRARLIAVGLFLLIGVATFTGCIREAFLSSQIHIGGASTSVEAYEAFGQQWALFNVANRLCITQVGTTQSDDYSIDVPGYINDILVLVYSGDGRTYALLAMGTEGVGVADVTNPANILYLGSARVNYFQDGITWTEGGGDIVTGNTISSTRSSITALESDGFNLWIANEDFGIHRTALSNVIGPAGLVLEPDGTLLIEAETYTLQYAGENPWGGPKSLVLYDGHLFASLGYLGMGIFDAATLEKVGSYNHYTDASVVEDWYIDMNVATEVQNDGMVPYLDPFTGMPDYRQASFEILEVWHGDIDAPTPWADFDRYGREYYNARDVDVATFDGITIAYIAYGLSGLMAVDVTGYDTVDSSKAFLVASYLGYAPGVPAHGPDTPTGHQSNSLFSHQGSGRLKESGVVSVRVVDTQVYYGDHFAGLAILNGADDPAANWHGPMAPYDNDDPSLADGVLGDHFPAYEWVTSYDMAGADPEDHEALPAWMYETPAVLVTGEISGHGGSLVVMPVINTAFGNIDVVQCNGAGGMVFLDLLNPGAVLNEDRFAVSVHIPTTREIGASWDGSPTQAVSIGHTEAVAVSRDYLYVGDGPHGMSAWRLTNSRGTRLPIEGIHLVANTLQDEYPIDTGTETVYPTPHAHGVIVDDLWENAMVFCRIAGLRRVPIVDVEMGAGTVGSPILMKPTAMDIFEHHSEAGGLGGIKRQDHAQAGALMGSLAFVADGSNGLTVYDLSLDPTDPGGAFIVGNVGAESGNPQLGRATAVALWSTEDHSTYYALVAAGQKGVGVVNVTNPANMQLVKVFEPIKIEDGKVGHADGRSVDVEVVGDLAYFSYDSFGVVAYSIADLIEPLPEGIDPNEVWSVQGDTLEYDYRPKALGRFKLQDQPGLEEYRGGALYMSTQPLRRELLFYIAYGTAGVAKVDWFDPEDPVLLQHADTAGEATGTAVGNGRVYVADGSGGLVIFE